MDILAGATRAAVHEGEIALLHACKRNLQRLLGAIGHIVLAVVGRHVVLSRIDAENGKIPGMAGPHPVVRLAAELADGRRRGSDEAYVAVFAEDKEEVLVAVVKGFNAGFQALPVLHSGLADLLGILPHKFRTGFLIHLGIIAFKHLGRHVFHPFEEPHGQAGIGQFLAPVHGPETVLQVVMFHGGMSLDIAVAAVVIGEKKAFVAHQFSGAAPAEKDDGVLQGGLVHAVDVLGVKAETLGLHVGYSL